ncbi:MAG: hypothetical protein AAF871_02000 [Pseudomonadota bacterium]
MDFNLPSFILLILVPMAAALAVQRLTVRRVGKWGSVAFGVVALVAAAWLILRLGFGTGAA